VESDLRDTQRPRVLAFYLPQFHPIPENDEWWGAGFTEWTNVARAKKLYPGHDQPRIPGELGFYDLRLPETRHAQAELAREHGVAGFIYWHYWFGSGRTILDRPFDEVLTSGTPNLPFCLAWANQTWSGIWHGDPDRILIEQTYPDDEDYHRHFERVLPAFRDPRYFRVDGKPLFYIMFPSALPDPRRFVALWRQWARDAGLAGLYLVGSAERDAPRAGSGFDAFVGPCVPDLYIRRRDVLRRLSRRLGVPPVYSYRRYSAGLPHRLAGVTSLPCVLPGWDNTPRCGARGVVLHSPEPAAFRGQVERAVQSLDTHSPEEKIIFVKSWNEWAESNYLEPDQHHGRAFLEALRDGLQSGAQSAPAPRADRRAPARSGDSRSQGPRVIARLRHESVQSDPD
jgi:hypothetical protein